MPSTFEVDGAIVQDPSAQDIELGFASIDAEGPRSMSIIQLQRAEKSLWAFGHPKDGYTLDLDEKAQPDGKDTSKVTSPERMIPHHDVVKLFQAFAVGEDSWVSKYEWEEQSNISTSRTLKNIAVLILIFVVLFLLLKYVLKVF